MLNLVNPEAADGKPIMDIVREFRRVQVSRFPLLVKFSEWHRGAGAKFYDSRFASKPSVAKVWQDADENGNKFWIVESRLIINDRFVRGNDRRNQKQTKDPKKLLRYMRDYVRPYGGGEIALDCFNVYESGFGDWRYRARNKADDYCRLSRDDVMEEFNRMQALGYKPQTEKVVAVMQNGLPAWQEHKRIENRKVMRVHVFFNPDQTVEIFCDDKMGYGGIAHGTTAYSSIEETPMCIQQHVAMLRMMEDKTFVPEVGAKVDADNYWIEVFPE